ncbi:MAG: ribbon-helix-helix protein, CopG family [Chloroflexi bacterium]|nr:ribbon-helix-helix protein, CopG family [Chloroflexota bacterium]
MATLQVKNLPEETYEQLRQLAKRRNTTISATVRQAVDRELEAASWWDDWDKTPRSNVKIDSAELLKEARELRDAGLE